MDGHFVVEQAARQASGLFLNFNGTAGVWRRAAIEASGGWQADTLCEDLDLSYRAQLAGWRLVYLPDLAVPAELPVQMEAFKRQQARWAKGSMQTTRKLIGPLLRARLPLGVKIEGVLHLTGYGVHPLILAAIALALPMSLIHSAVLRFVPYLMIVAVGPPLMSLLAGTPEGPGWRARLRLLPTLIALGMGLSLNNSRAVWDGLFARERGHFARTPKFAVGTGGDRWQASRYVLPLGGRAWGEVGLLVFALVSLVAITRQGGWGLVPWLLLYACGFAYVGGVSLWQAAELRVSLGREETTRVRSKRTNTAAGIPTTAPGRFRAGWQGQCR
ncbi:MAG: glycosyltransferase [Chloroflexi bacterium]|nr:glycosyltransferase [Chloroflexota bacterium]